MNDRNALLFLIQFAIGGSKSESEQIAIYDCAAAVSRSIGCANLEITTRELACALREISEKREALAAKQLRFDSLLTATEGGAQ